MAADERSTCFLEECQGLSEDKGVKEAERCLNCGCSCMQSCPFDVIQFDGKAGVSHKCTLCSDLIQVGQKPICVDVCLTDALKFGEHELLKQNALDQGKTVIQELSQAGHIYVR